MKNCDKCRTEVPKENDVLYVYALAFDLPVVEEYDPVTQNAIIIPGPHRHFLPIPGVCEGSPSSFQYIEGQPRDKRGYPYFQEHESKWRQGHKKLQELVAEGKISTYFS